MSEVEMRRIPDGPHTEPITRRSLWRLTDSAGAVVGAVEVNCLQNGPDDYEPVVLTPSGSLRIRQARS